MSLSIIAPWSILVSTGHQRWFLVSKYITSYRVSIMGHEEWHLVNGLHIGRIIHRRDVLFNSWEHWAFGFNWEGMRSDPISHGWQEHLRVQKVVWFFKVRRLSASRRHAYGLAEMCQKKEWVLAELWWDAHFESNFLTLTESKWPLYFQRLPEIRVCDRSGTSPLCRRLFETPFLEVWLLDHGWNSTVVPLLGLHCSLTE